MVLKMKKTKRKLLLELIKNSKRSDRELAKVLGVSQATVSRMRNDLIKNGWIKQFTIIPDLAKMGFEILAISSFKSTNNEGIIKKAIEWTRARPEIVFAARAEGQGKNGVVISIHKNYTDYSNFLKDLRLEGISNFDDYDTLFISLSGLIVKDFSLKHLAKREEALEG